MAEVLRVNDVWRRIRALCRRAGPRLVAVPFLGAGASTRLRLRRGDLLVIRCDKATVRAGLTDPREVVKYLADGVEVHHSPSLHAKVLVFGKSALVGSTNVSSLSETRLVEAAIETNNPAMVRQCKAFVDSLRGDVIGAEYARRLTNHYRPPRIGKAAGSKRTGRGRSIPSQSNLWVVRLEYMDWLPDDDIAAEKARPRAHKKLRDKSQFTVEEFIWTGSVPFREGDRVLMCTLEAPNRILVNAPSRILVVHPYRSGRRHRAIVAVEVQRGLNRISLTTLRKKIGPAIGPVARIARARRLRDPRLVYALGRAWPRAWRPIREG